MKQFAHHIAFSGYLLLLPLVSFAQGTGGGSTGGGGGSTGGGGGSWGGGGGSTDCSPGTLCNPLKEVSICGFLKDVLHIVISLAIPVMVCVLVWAGFRFVIARGNPTELTKARLNLMYVFIGIALFLGAWTLGTVLVGTINTLQPNSVGSC